MTSKVFEFATAGRIRFGAGVVESVPDWVGETAARSVFLLTGRDPGRAEGLSHALAKRGLAVATFTVAEEPTVTLVRQAVAALRKCEATAVIAFGGGSVIDAGKATAILATNGGEPLDFMEGVGAGRAIAIAGLPFAAIPTTAGTGSEVTRNAVLADPDSGVKASLRSPLMLPSLAVVDPDLIASASSAVIANGGLDALSQLAESFLSLRANPITDTLAREGIRCSARALPIAFREGLKSDAALRADLALASLYGGLCLANAGLGAIHGFAAPLGGMFNAPHGAVCAALFPHVVRGNVHTLRARAPKHPALERFHELASLLTGRPSAAVTAEDGIAWLESLCHDLRVPTLRHYGLREDRIPELVAKTLRASSTKGNPIELTATELTEIAFRAL